ncbi:phosphohydrolase [Asanoa sp. WMMD1127]|uniref:phosphohydrolase n=1 Tax=Asanoa sp. WMMD1127 TaxID=3016107 RepID=UPI002415F29A|nr:phosphohydrolase [Asanoa sp. WMMD1127]MDG4821079.1 phosphohydrolase [Asanoa sp. WMMD1127]
MLARALDPDDTLLRPLPVEVADLLVALDAPPRLAAHLRAVHDVACQLTTALRARYPALIFDREAVHYGAATHDIGKVIHPEELSGPGSAHEPAGHALLDLVTARLAESCGIERWAAFAGLDDVLDAIAVGADRRLAYQASHPVRR